MTTHLYPPDPTGRLADLAAALADPLLDQVPADGPPDPGSAQAAYRLAVALGYCRLYGIDPGELDGTLPGPVAAAAAARLADRLGAWADEAARLGDRWAAARDPVEADQFVGRLLLARTDAWAALEAVHEAAAASAEDGDPLAAAVGAALDRTAGPLDRFDAALEPHADILSTLAGTPLLTGWERHLADEYRAARPWWLGEPARVGPAGRRPGPGFALPEVVPAASIAADPGRVVLAGPRWVWVRPDGAYRAVLNVPVVLADGPSGPRPVLPSDELPKPRPLNFLAADGSPARGLAGQPVRFGANGGLVIDAEGRVLVALADLAPGDARLAAGDPLQEWTPEAGR